MAPPSKSPLESFDRPVFTARTMRARRRRRIVTFVAILLIFAAAIYYLVFVR